MSGSENKLAGRAVTKWLSLAEASEMLGVHPTTLRRWADNGDIPVRLTPGKHRRFLELDVEAFLKRKAHQETEHRAWGDYALVQTRQRLVTEPAPRWLTAFGSDARNEERELGRRLLGLIIQHMSVPDDDERLLIEARSIAARYAQNCILANLSAAEGLEATTFFRDTMTELALQMPQIAELGAEAPLRVLRKLNQVFNVLQISLIEYYDSYTQP
jgi:excisionase family DNA binding protein